MFWIHSWLVITFGDETFHSRFEQEWRPTKKVGEFKESEKSWTQYVEYLAQYFLVNEIEGAAK